MAYYRKTNKLIPHLPDSNYASYVDQFRTGELNVLVVPVEIEPSIELGHTDLVVLFNITDRPLEFLCHIARTRGGQPGAIVTMTIEGPEQEEITEIINNRRMHYYENRDILPIGVDLSDSMVRGSPALIPPGFHPKGRHVLFNRQATTVVENGTGTATSSASPSPTLLPISPQLVVAEKRRVLEVLSDSPATYDAINGCTYYQVMQVPSQPSLVRTPASSPQAEGTKSPGGGQ